MRRPWPTAPYVRPSHFRETLEAQKNRIAAESEQASLQHANQIGKAVLERLQVARINGDELDAETAEHWFRGALKLDGVPEKYTEGVIAVYLPKYTAGVRGEGA